MRVPKKQCTRQVIKALYNQIGRRCYLCGCEMPFNDMTADHVFPKSHGYSIVCNAMPACHPCNCKKGNTAPSVELLEFVTQAYEATGMTFDPRINMAAPPKPIEYYIRQLMIDTEELMVA